MRIQKDLTQIFEKKKWSLLEDRKLLPIKQNQKNSN